MRTSGILVSPILTVPKAGLDHMQRTGELMGRFFDWLEAHGQLEEPPAPDARALLYRAAALHDVGKRGIPLEILDKPGALTAAEWREMQSHTWQGEAMIPPHADPTGTIRGVCRHHHERWDGSGYPDGLAGIAIPYAARLMAVVDVYDALTHERPYKAAYAHTAALEIILQGSGKQFDPAICRAFEAFMN